MSDDWELIVLIRQKGQINLFRDVDARSRSFEGLLGFLSIGSLSPARVFVLTYMLRVTNAYSKKKKKKKKRVIGPLAWTPYPPAAAVFTPTSSLLPSSYRRRRRRRITYSSTRKMSSQNNTNQPAGNINNPKTGSLSS
jgi:hypothetical protein